MENRLQHFLLIGMSLCLLAGLTQVAPAAESNGGKLRANSELFDVGFVAGIISIEDFPSEYVVGANLTFKASEDFFLQYNYIQTDVAESNFEKQSTSFALGDDRSFVHYDLLVGYNVLQGEFFASEEKAHLSNLYVVAGVGETELGAENNFTYTLGVGYQVEFFRKYLMRVDYRDYIFETTLIGGGDKNTVHNNQFSVGVGYLF